MTAAALSYIPDILEEHLEELGFLWGQRRGALRSPRYSQRAFAQLEERITGHHQGLLSVGGEALPLLEDTLQEGDDLAAFAAGYGLLHHHDPTATERVLDAFAAAQNGRLGGLRDALCHGPAQSALARLQALANSAPSAPAVAAAEALAFHKAPGATDALLRQFLRDEDAAVRTGGWRLAAYLGLRLDAKAYAAGVRDDPPVRSAALHAAGWCGEPGILALGRKYAEFPDPEDLDALQLLAILGGPEDVPRFAALGSAPDLGPARFRLLGSFGHPALMDLILAGMRDADPATAVAAGEAFTKLTGADITSGVVVTVPAEGGESPDEFESEFQDEVALPDAAQAEQHWEKVSASLSQATRICRGVDIGGQIDAAAFAALDMESRWETALRARFQGLWSGSPLRLEQLQLRT